MDKRSSSTPAGGFLLFPAENREASFITKVSARNRKCGTAGREVMRAPVMGKCFWILDVCDYWTIWLDSGTRYQNAAEEAESVSHWPLFPVACGWLTFPKFESTDSSKLRHPHLFKVKQSALSCLTVCAHQPPAAAEPSAAWSPRHSQYISARVSCFRMMCTPQSCLK